MGNPDVTGLTCHSPARKLTTTGDDARWEETNGLQVRGLQGPLGQVPVWLKASNGQVVATGEAYETKAAAKKGCESVLRAATGAPIEEVES